MSGAVVAHLATVSSASGGTGTVARVSGQVATWTDTVEDATSRTLTLSSSVTIGNRLWLYVGATSHDVASLSVTDGLGNTWTAAQNSTYLDPHGVGWFTAPVTVSGSCTVTINKNGAATSVNAELEETSGINSTTALDGAVVASSGSGTNAGITSSSVTNAGSRAVTIVCGDPASAFTPGTVASGFTADQSLNNEATFTQLKTAFFNSVGSGTHAAGWPSMTNAGANKWAVLVLVQKSS